MILLAFFLFKLAYTAYCPDFSYESTDLLLNGIEAHQTGQVQIDILSSLKPYFEVSQYEVARYEAQKQELSHILSLPNDLIVFIFLFLDYKSGKSFLEVSKLFNNSGRLNIRNRLFDFSPSFLFNSDWLNHAMACELSNYFPSGVKLSDSSIYDNYELATIKLIRDEIKVDLLPYQIQYKLRSYLHEILYGELEMITVEESHWRIALMNKLTKRALPETLDYYLYISFSQCDTIFTDERENHLAKQHLNFTIDLHTGDFTMDSYKEYAEKIRKLHIEDIRKRLPFNLEVDISLDSNFHLLRVPEEDIEKSFKKIILNNGFSQSFFDRIALDEFLACKIYINVRNNRIFIKAYMYRFVDEHYIHLMDCNAQNRFKLASIRYAANTIENFMKITVPNLSLIDILVNIVRSGYLNLGKQPGYINSFLMIAAAHGSDISFEIVFKESPSPVNVFKMNGNDKLINIFNNCPDISERKFKVYIDYLLIEKDPLPLIFINHDILLKFKHLIVDKFDLNRNYLVDMNLHLLDQEKVNLRKLKSIDSYTVSFHQILNVFERLFDVFTSSADYDVPPTSTRPISISKFVYNSVIERV